MSDNRESQENALANHNKAIEIITRYEELNKDIHNSRRQEKERADKLQKILDEPNPN